MSGASGELDRAAGVEGKRYRRGVVICIQGEGGRWLMMRRAAGVSRAPGKIAFPGGEVHEGESAEEAVVREAREELGIEVRAVRRVWEHVWEETGWFLEGWLAERVRGELRPDEREVGELLWLSGEEAIAATERGEGLVTIPSLIGALRAAMGNK